MQRTAGQSGATILSNFLNLNTTSAPDRAAVGADFPFAVTEFNSLTSGDFSSINDTTDTPAMAAKLGTPEVAAHSQPRAARGFLRMMT